MSNIGYAIMGTPNGFQSINIGIIENKRIGKTVDFDNRGMQIFPNSEVFGVIKKIEDSSLLTYYVLYRYAKEIDRDRTGAFYGSVIVLKNSYAEGTLIYPMLVELAANVRAYTRQDGKFLTPLDQIDFREPTSLRLLRQSIRPINSGFEINSSKAFFDISQSGNVLSFFRTMFQKDGYLNLGSGFASESAQVITGVKRKELYPITALNDDYELNIQKLESKNNQLEADLEEAKSNIVTLNQHWNSEREQAQKLEGQLSDSIATINSIRARQPHYSGSNYENNTYAQEGNFEINHSGRNNYSNRLPEGMVIKVIIGILLFIFFGGLIYFLSGNLKLLFHTENSPATNKTNKSYMKQKKKTGSTPLTTNTSLTQNQTTTNSDNNSSTNAQIASSTQSSKGKGSLSNSGNNLKNQAKEMAQTIANNNYYYEDKSVAPLIQEMKKKFKKTPEYRELVKVYNNWLNTGLPVWKFKKIIVRPISGRGLDAIASDVISKNSYLSNCLEEEAIKENLRYFNEDHIQGNNINSSNANLILWIPRKNECK